MVMWALVGANSTNLLIVVALALSGAGLGIASPALTSLTANAVAESDLGVAGAMQQLMSQMGAVLGSVVLTSIAVSGGPQQFGPFHVAFVVGAAVSLAGAVVAGFVRSTPRGR
jgi:MFS family permease